MDEPASALDPIATQRIEAVPGSGTAIPLWILGSSLFGAGLAAELGLPYAFASHFAPQLLDRAIAVYRARFKPSAQSAAPYVMVGVNVIAAETDDEARRLWTSQQMSFTGIVRGTRSLLQPPIDAIDDYWSPDEKAYVSQMMSCSVVGSRDSVGAGLQALVDRTRADECIVVSDVYDFALRLRSLVIIAEAARGVRPPAAEGIAQRRLAD